MRLALLFLLTFMSTASAHDHYTGKSDPVTKSSCCGGHDCAVLRIEPGVLTPEDGGVRIRLTQEQARKINPARKGAVNAFVPDSRVQQSWDGQYHMCFAWYPTNEDFYCFWAPPNT